MFVKYWNTVFYFDYLYRKELKIPVFSQQHLETDIKDILFWYQEFVFYIEMNKSNDPSYVTEEQKDLAKSELERLRKKKNKKKSDSNIKIKSDGRQKD